MKAIHKEQKYEEADNIVTFNHVINFTMAPREVRAKAAISTLFETSALEWDLHLHKQFNGRLLNSRENWVISMFASGNRDHYPPLKRLQFKINLLDSEGNVFKSLTYFIDGSVHFPPNPTRNYLPNVRRRAERKEYVTDTNSSFCKELREVMMEARKKEIQMELETRLEFLKADFLDVRYLIGEGGPMVENINEYYFDSITNRNRHDLKIKSANGINYIMANKEILCMASSYFRQILKENTEEITVSSAEMIESVEIVLVYLLTGHYKKPSSLSPRLALEVYQLANLWKAFEPKTLKNSLEKQCYEELCKNREDLNYVCNLLLMADEGQFANVVSSCISTINYYHFPDFLRIMIHGNHPLKERFSARREFMRPSLNMMIKRVFAASNDTKRFVKFIPAIGED